MKVTSIDDIKRTFLMFRDECTWVQTCFNTFQALYKGGSKVDELLQNTAPVFFEELNKIYVEYWILIVCRITDPSNTKGDDNLTVKYLVEGLTQHGLISSEITQIACSLDSYRMLVNDARNKLVTHADRDSYLQGNVLGGSSEEAIEQFLLNLQQFNNLVGEAVGEGPLDYQATSCSGDVYDLLQVL